MLLESEFRQLFFQKYSFKLFIFSNSYARKQKWVFFSEHNVFSTTRLVNKVGCVFILYARSDKYYGGHADKKIQFSSRTPCTLLLRLCTPDESWSINSISGIDFSTFSRLRTSCNKKSK